MNRSDLRIKTRRGLWAAWSLFTSVLAALAHGVRAETATASGPAPVVKRVSVEEFDRRRADGKHTVLDVRTVREFAAGHVPGATNIDVNAADFAARVATLDRQKPCLVYCAVGARSARAVKKLRELGFKELYDFAGGWAAWRASGKPVER